VTGRTVLANGDVFDGAGESPRRVDVAIEGGRIVELGQRLGGDERLDVDGAAIYPGFIDCHAHVAFGDDLSIEASAARSPARNAFAAIANLRATLAGGVTTVRDAAGADAGYRDAIAAGEVDGPRLLVSLVQLSPSAGPYDARTPSGFSLWLDTPGIPNPVADGVDGVRAKVREVHQLGGDVVKIFATGHFAMAREGARRSMFTEAELRAIVEEAAFRGMRVMAHAHGAAGGAAAARAGVSSIEHGFYLDDVALEAMAECGTVFVPTLLASAALPDDVRQQHRAVVRAAHDRGIPIAMGTDCPAGPHGTNLRELELLVECGLSPTEALLAGTSVAARLLGLEAEIGQIAPGFAADLVVADGDPLDVVGLPARIRRVYRDGRLVSSRT
jgi:imidazolonepropionase-like amidohydrolase